MKRYEVNIMCGETDLTNDYFSTRKAAMEHVETYNPFDKGMNADIVSDIKAYGLFFTVSDKTGAFFETKKYY